MVLPRDRPARGSFTAAPREIAFDSGIGSGGFDVQSSARMRNLLPLIILLGSLAPPALLATTPDNGVPFDLQGFIDQQVVAGQKKITIPPGRYRVTPRDRQHLSLRELRDVQIIADGVEMICTETTRALTITRCTNVTMRGLVIDYDPLPFTQGRITAFSTDKKIHDSELFDGDPAAASALNFKCEIFRPDSRTLRCEDRYPSRVEATGPRSLRVHLAGGRESDREQVD